MIDYNNLDLALIVANCQNPRELLKAGSCIRFLYNEGESINLRFFQHIANKRMRQLV